MASYEELFSEDENDIFCGSPKSKFFDVVNEASKEIVEDQLDKMIEKLAILEMIISQNKDVDFDINRYLEEYKFDKQEDIDILKKDLYIEFTGEIISRLDS